jgi:RNA polymerase sigma factor (sigma-70 family)
MSEVHFEHINILVSKAQTGDEKSAEELLDFYQPLIKATVRKCIHIHQELSKHYDDLVNIASLEFYKLVLSYDVTRSFFSYYISARLYVNLVRASKSLMNKSEDFAEVNFSDMPKLWDPSYDPFGKIETEIVIQQALEELKPSYKQAINYVFFDQLTQEEAAERLNISQSAFQKRLNRALKNLKEILGKKYFIVE